MVRALSHYKILSEISRGGMGIVYRAVDVKLGREIALKVLPEVSAENKERVALFEHEAQLPASGATPILPLSTSFFIHGNRKSSN